MASPFRLNDSFLLEYALRIGDYPVKFAAHRGGLNGLGSNHPFSSRGCALVRDQQVDPAQPGSYRLNTLFLRNR